MYDPVHPPGTLEESLSASACLGTIDEPMLPQSKSPAEETERTAVESLPVASLLNIDEIEAAATRKISRKAWAYYYSAADDLQSKNFNNRVYRDILLRPRVFVDCTRCSLSTSMVGNVVNTPIFVSPAAMARLAHPSGEQGIAQACAKFGAAQIISNNASMKPEQIVEGASEDQVFGWQLYVQNDRSKSETMLRRIEKLRPRIKFVVLTLDAPVPGKREDDERESIVGENLSVTSAVHEEKKANSSGHVPPEVNKGPEGSASGAEKKAEDPSGGGVGRALFAGTAADLTWKTTLPWLAKYTDLPIVLKGLQTHEDAAIAAIQYPQVKGIVLSNHGGRAADTAPPAIHTLLEIRKYCPWVLNRIDVWVDGGIKRGTDVVKALCLGAKAVGIGRPALFGLGAGGPEGVERVLESKLLGHERIQLLHGLK